MPQATNRSKTTARLDSGQRTERSKVYAGVDTTVNRHGLQTNALLEGLSAMEPGLKRFIEVEEQLHIEDEIAEGQAAGAQETRNSAEIREAQARGEVHPDATPYFRRGYMTIVGRKAGREAVANLQEKMAAGEFNPEKDDLEAFLAENADDLSGLDSDSYLDGYTPVLEAGLANIRSSVEAGNRQRIKDTIHEELSFNVQDIIDSGGPLAPAELTALINDQANVFGLPKKEATEVIINSMEKYIHEGRPEIFEVFKNANVEGAGGTYADHPAFGAQIERMRKAAKTVADRKLDFTKIKELSDAQTAARNGSLSVGWIQKQVALGDESQFTNAQLASLYTQSRAHVVKTTVGSGIDAVRTAGRGAYEPDSAARQASIQRDIDFVVEQSGQDLETLILGASQGDPEAVQYVSPMLQKFAQNGDVSKQFKAILEKAPLAGAQMGTGETPEQFKVANALWRIMQPYGLDVTHVKPSSEGATAMFAYDTLLESGIEDSAAYQTVSSFYNDPQMMEKYKKTPRYEDVNAAVSEAADGPWFNNAENTGYIHMEMSRYADTFGALGFSMEQIVEKSKEAVLRNNIIQNGQMVPRTAMTEWLNSETPEQDVESNSERILYRELGKEGIEDIDGYFLQPHPELKGVTLLRTPNRAVKRFLRDQDIMEEDGMAMAASATTMGDLAKNHADTKRANAIREEFDAMPNYAVTRGMTPSDFKVAEDAPGGLQGFGEMIDDLTGWLGRTLKPAEEDIAIQEWTEETVN